MLLNTRNPFFFFVFAIIASSGLSTGIAYEDLIATLDENFDNGHEIKNIELIDSLLSGGQIYNYNCFQQGTIMNKQGVAYYFLNQETKAIDIFENKVLKVWEDCSEAGPEEKANTIYNIGVAYQYTDQIIRGQDYIERALSLLSGSGRIDTIDLIFKLQGAGSYYVDINDLERAENHYRNALLYFTENTDLIIEKFDILNQLLLLKINFKQYEEAQFYFQELKKILINPEVDIYDSDKAILFLNGARAAFETGDFEGAEERADAALAIAQITRDDFLISNALEIIGLVAKERKRFDQAEELFNRVKDIRSELSTSTYGQIGLAIILENLAELSRAQEKLEVALGYLNLAKETLSIQVTSDIATSELISPYEVDLARVLFIEAQVLRSLFLQRKEDSLLLQSNQLFDQIDLLIQNQLKRPQSEYSKINIYEILADYYKEASLSELECYEHFNQDIYLERAYEFCAKSKSLILQHRLAESQLHRNGNENIEISSLLGELVAIKRSLIERSAPEDSLLLKLSHTQNLLDNHMSDLRGRYPNSYGVMKNSNQLQTKIESSEVLVEFLNIQDSWVSFWISSNSLTYFRIKDLSNQNIQNLLDEYSDPSKSINNEKSFEVYQALLEEGLIRYQPKKILIIPDNILHYLPFDALISSEDYNQFLIEKYATAYLFSNQWLNSNRYLRGREFAGFGTTYSPNLNQLLHEKKLIPESQLLPPLTNARAELTSASSHFDGKIFLDRDATLDKFHSVSSTSDIIYLALHGLVNRKQANHSSVIFDDTTVDCVLYASDVNGLRMNNSLVLMSSCHSADGKIYKGEGIYGMSRAFFAAGAKGLISSLWNASENSSESILTSMLSFLKTQKSTSLALQAAKKAYLTNAVPSQRHPFYWANYVTYGDVYLPAQSPNYLFALGALLLFVIVFTIYRFFF